jgi:hypothetical protein
VQNIVQYFFLKKVISGLFRLSIENCENGGSCFSTFSFLCSALEIVRFPFFLFLFVIVSSVLLRFTDSSYPFDILKLFFKIKGSFELNIGGFQKLQLT